MPTRLALIALLAVLALLVRPIAVLLRKYGEVSRRLVMAWYECDARTSKAGHEYETRTSTGRSEMKHALMREHAWAGCQSPLTDLCKHGE